MQLSETMPVSLITTDDARDFCFRGHLPITVIIIESENNEMVADTVQRLVIKQLTMTGLKEKQIRVTNVKIPNLVKVVTQIARHEDLWVLVESESDEKQTFLKSSNEKIKDTVSFPTLIIFRKMEETQTSE